MSLLTRSELPPNLQDEDWLRSPDTFEALKSQLSTLSVPYEKEKEVNEWSTKLAYPSQKEAELLNSLLIASPRRYLTGSVQKSLTASICSPVYWDGAKFVPQFDYKQLQKRTKQFVLVVDNCTGYMWMLRMKKNLQTTLVRFMKQLRSQGHPLGKAHVYGDSGRLILFYGGVIAARRRPGCRTHVESFFLPEFKEAYIRLRSTVRLLQQNVQAPLLWRRVWGHAIAIQNSLYRDSQLNLKASISRYVEVYGRKDREAALDNQRRFLTKTLPFGESIWVHNTIRKPKISGPEEQTSHDAFDKVIGTKGEPALFMGITGAKFTNVLYLTLRDFKIRQCMELKCDVSPIKFGPMVTATNALVNDGWNYKALGMKMRELFVQNERNRLLGMESDSELSEAESTDSDWVKLASQSDTEQAEKATEDAEQQAEPVKSDVEVHSDVEVRSGADIQFDICVTLPAEEPLTNEASVLGALTELTLTDFEVTSDSDGSLVVLSDSDLPDGSQATT